jgi:hypothetical protein
MLTATGVKETMFAAHDKRCRRFAGDCVAAPTEGGSAVSLLAGFMHLPKTGGNSLHHVITSHLPSLRVCPSPRLGVWDYQPVCSQSYDFYSGHFDFDLFGMIGAGALRLTMIRHPVARAVSLYDYWRGFTAEETAAVTAEIPDNGPRFASSVDFGTFVSSPTPFVRTHTENGLTRQLLGSLYNELKSNLDWMIDEAQGRLSTFDWIGVTEYFNDSVRSLADLLEFKLNGEIPKLNNSYVRPSGKKIVPTRPTEREISIVEYFNSADMALYHRVAVGGCGKWLTPRGRPRDVFVSGGPVSKL